MTARRSGPPIEARTARREYEQKIAPRGLLVMLAQKSLHILARFCIHGGLRVALYRAMGIHIGHHVYIGMDTWLDDQFPELIVLEDDVVISFRVTVIVHDCWVVVGLTGTNQYGFCTVAVGENDPDAPKGQLACHV
jgi:hypothetical protein